MQSNIRIPRKYSYRMPGAGEPNRLPSHGAGAQVPTDRQQDLLASQLSEMAIPQQSILKNSISFLDSALLPSQPEAGELQLKPVAMGKGFFSRAGNSGHRCLINNMKFMLSKKKKVAQTAIKKEQTRLFRGKRILSSESPLPSQNVEMTPLAFESEMVFPWLGDAPFIPESVTVQEQDQNLVLNLINRKPLLSKAKGVFRDDYQLDEAKKERGRVGREEMLAQTQESNTMFKQGRAKEFKYSSPAKKLKRCSVFPPKLDRKLKERQRKYDAGRSLAFMDVKENLWTQGLNQKWDEACLGKRIDRVKSKNFCDFFEQSDEENEIIEEICIPEEEEISGFESGRNSNNLIFVSPKNQRESKKDEMASTNIDKLWAPAFAARTPSLQSLFESRKNSCTSLDQTPQPRNPSLNRFLTSDRARLRSRKQQPQTPQKFTGFMTPQLKNGAFNAVMNPNIVSYESNFPALLPMLETEDSLEQICEEEVGATSVDKELEAMLGDPSARPNSLRINTAVDLFSGMGSPRDEGKEAYAINVSFENGLRQQSPFMRSPSNFHF